MKNYKANYDAGYDIIRVVVADEDDQNFDSSWFDFQAETKDEAYEMASLYFRG